MTKHTLMLLRGFTVGWFGFFWAFGIGTTTYTVLSIAGVLCLIEAVRCLVDAYSSN